MTTTIYHCCAECDYVLEDGEEFCPEHPNAMIHSFVGGDTKMETIKTYEYSTDPQAAIDGWDPNACGADDYKSPRALALYEALGADPSDEEYTLAEHIDSGRWGLFGMTVTGHRFAVEQ